MRCVYEFTEPLAQKRCRRGVVCAFAHLLDAAVRSELLPDPARTGATHTRQPWQEATRQLC